MIGVQNEKNVQSALESGIRPVLRFGSPEQHVQEISRVAQIIVGVDIGHAQRVPVGKSSNRRHLADQAVGLLLARLGAEDVFRVVIEGGERGDSGNSHAHGMSVVVKPIEKFLDAFMDEGVMGDVVGPILQLCGGRQFAVQQQIGRFQVGALFCEIFDGIAAVAQDAGVAIDKRDSAYTGGGVVERRVVAHQPEFLGIDFDLAQVGGANGAVLDGNFVGFSGAIVGNGKRFAGRGGGVRFSRLRSGKWRAHSKVLGGSGAVA